MRARGLTMIEVVAASVITAILLVAALQTLAAVQLTVHKAADYRAGRLLAAELVSKILVLKYADPQTPAAPLGPDASETPATYDDVDDYATYDHVQAAKVLGQTADPDWRSTAEVVWVRPADPNGDQSKTESGLKRITVTTERRGVRVASVVAFRSSAP